ncbi:hypothetical protein HY768_06385 [candidate division TA06 bacterium]|uniref:Uncharacterized protein n=1 Tax=candidate division TA06 bacterium TaxID=2250710 RepID=A0A933I982_UNCT6|nr:hypothetical protein [candidate division TA06 bacterium]
MTKLKSKKQTESKGRGRPKGVKVKGLAKRNAAIAARVSRGIETYKKIGADYGLTRERVRQIAQDMIPQAGSRVYRGSGKYGWCPRCRTLLKKHEADGSRRPNTVDPRNELCGKCRQVLYRQSVVITCRSCGNARTMKIGLVLWMLNNSVRVGHMKLDAGGRTGTRLCRQCTYDSMKIKGLGRSLNLRYKAALKRGYKDAK